MYLTETDLREAVSYYCTTLAITLPKDAWVQAIYKRLLQEGFTRDMVLRACVYLADRAENFVKLPMPGDFLKAVGRTPEMQAELVLSHLKDLNSASAVIFDDPRTNFVIEKRFGGLSKFRHEYCKDEFTQYVYSAKSFKDEFISAYEAAVVGRKELNAPLIAEGSSRERAVITAIGDKTVCNLLLEKSQEQQLLMGE